MEIDNEWPRTFVVILVDKAFLIQKSFPHELKLLSLSYLISNEIRWHLLSKLINARTDTKRGCVSDKTTQLAALVGNTLLQYCLALLLK